jgi:hypothetical protein
LDKPLLKQGLDARLDLALSGTLEHFFYARYDIVSVSSTVTKLKDNSCSVV